MTIAIPLNSSYLRSGVWEEINPNGDFVNLYGESYSDGYGISTSSQIWNKARFQKQK